MTSYSFLFHFLYRFCTLVFFETSKMLQQFERVGESYTCVFLSAVTETRYLNASNRELAAPQDAQASTDVVVDPPGSNNKDVPQLLEFNFQELKSATGNFRPDSILGEGGFGYVFKGWIEENGTAPARPGTGVTVAVKSLKPDGLQGHREWVVSRLFWHLDIWNLRWLNSVQLLYSFFFF